MNMYDNNLAVNSEPQKTEVVSVRIMEKIEVANKVQRDTIEQIQNKLHSLLNKRTPEKEPGSDALKPMIQDFYSALENQINTVSAHNNMLFKILKHLDEIV